MKVIALFFLAFDSDISGFSNDHIALFLPLFHMLGVPLPQVVRDFNGIPSEVIQVGIQPCLVPVDLQHFAVPVALHQAAGDLPGHLFLQFPHQIQTNTLQGQRVDSIVYVYDTCNLRACRSMINYTNFFIRTNCS